MGEMHMDGLAEVEEEVATGVDMGALTTELAPAERRRPDMLKGKEVLDRIVEVDARPQVPGAQAVA